MNKFIRHFYFFTLVLALQPLTGSRLVAMESAGQDAVVPATNGSKPSLSTETSTALNAAATEAWSDSDDGATWGNDDTGNAGGKKQDPMMFSVMTEADHRQQGGGSASSGKMQTSPHELPASTGDGVKNRHRSKSCSAAAMNAELHAQTTNSTTSSVDGEDGDDEAEEEEEAHEIGAGDEQVILSTENVAIVSAALAAAKEALRSAPGNDDAEPEVDFSAVGEILEGAHFSPTDAALAAAIIKCIAMAEMNPCSMSDEDDEHGSSSASHGFTETQRRAINLTLSGAHSFDVAKRGLHAIFDPAAVELIRMIMEINAENRAARANQEKLELQTAAHIYSPDGTLRRPSRNRSCLTCRDVACCCCGALLAQLIQQLSTLNLWQ